MSLPPSVPTLSSPVGVPPNPAGPKSVRTRDPHPGGYPPARLIPARLIPARLVLARQGGDQLGGTATAVEQVAHVRPGPAQGLKRGDTLQGLAPGNVEDHRVPRRRRDGLRVL